MVSVVFWREMLGWGSIVFILPDLHEVFKAALVEAGANVSARGSVCPAVSRLHAVPP